MACKLSICSWNANSISNKIGELINFASHHDIDIILLNETKLKPDDRLRLKGFNVIRKDRPSIANAGAGGVAALIRKGIPFTTLNLHCSVENVAFRLQDATTIIAAYNSPHNNFSRSDLDTLTNAGNKVIVAGDLNSKHQSWNCARSNRNGTTLYAYQTDNDITIHHSTTHTHFPTNNMTPTTIDIVLTKNVNNITPIKSLSELSSDHNPILFSLASRIAAPRYKKITSYKHT